VDGNKASISIAETGEVLKAPKILLKS